MVKIFVPDLPEFLPIVEAVRQGGGEGGCQIVSPRSGYWQIQASGPLSLSRKVLRLRTALWFSMLTGGYIGRLVTYDKDTVTLIEEDAAA